MIQGLVSNDVAGAPEDRAVYAAVLTAKGRMVATVRVLKRGGELLLETDRTAANGLMEHLRKFVPPLFARFESADEAWGEIGVYGPKSAGLLARVLGFAQHDRPGEDAIRTVELEGERIDAVATMRLGIEGYDLIVPSTRVEWVWQVLASGGAKPIGHATLDVLRIEACSPRWGAELTVDTIPLEAGLRGRAISESKGCYTGQEVIVRILHRGHVNWVLRQVRLGEAAAVAWDTPLVGEENGKKLGRMTSSAWSPRRGETIGLAYVRRELAAGSQLRLGAVDGPVVTVGDACGGGSDGGE
jgi:folate-binding protein YgfZ